MTDTENPPGPGHNNPPEVITPPEADVLADLESRYSDIDAQLTDIRSALATYPEKIEHEDQANSLGDVLSKAAKLRKTVLEPGRVKEKGRWDGLAKVVQNFFTTPKEEIEEITTLWKPRLQAFMDAKIEAERKKQAEELARQQVERDRLAAEAAAATKKREEEEARLAAARKAEEEARARAAEQERLAREAEERQRKAAEEAERLAAEKKRRDDAERAANATKLDVLRKHLKRANDLHGFTAAAEASEGDLIELDTLIRAGGTIGAIAAPLSASSVLSQNEKIEVELARARLGVLRAAFTDRLGKRDAKKRAKAEEEERKAQEKAAAERKRVADAEAARVAEANAKAADEAAARAAAEKAAQEAAQDIDMAVADQETGAKALKTAARDAKAAESQAERSDRLTDRMERRHGNSSDATLSQGRGELGSVASKTGMWKHEIVDDAALRAVCGPLGEHFTDTALAGAVYQWMKAHRSGFAEDATVITPPELPGVRFFWEDGVRIA